MSESPPPPPANPAPAVGDVWTVRRVLEWTTGHLQKHGSDTPRLDAEILLSHARQCRRIKLYTDYDEPLSDAVRGTMKDLVKRRAAKEPVAYLVGKREFFSLDFRVTPDVLIPRPDTETLVMEALALIKGETPRSVLDLCTGSGCVAISIAKNAPKAAIVATDVSPSALAIAQENGQTLGVTERVTWKLGDLWAAVEPGPTFDVIVSNPPYIRSEEIPTLDADVRQYEPKLALDGGREGLDVIRRIIDEAPNRLVPGGSLLLEIDPQQVTAVDALAVQRGQFEATRISKDLGGRARVWIAKTVS